MGNDDTSEGLARLLREQSDRREREHDKVMGHIQAISTKLELIERGVQEARHDVDNIRDDITPIHGIALQRADDRGKPERRRAASSDDFKIPRSWVVAAMPILKWVLIWIVAAGGWLLNLVQHAKH